MNDEVCPSDELALLLPSLLAGDETPLRQIVESRQLESRIWSDRTNSTWVAFREAVAAMERLVEESPVFRPLFERPLALMRRDQPFVGSSIEDLARLDREMEEAFELRHSDRNRLLDAYVNFERASAIDIHTWRTLSNRLSGVVRHLTQSLKEHFESGVDVVSAAIQEPALRRLLPEAVRVEVDTRIYLAQRKLSPLRTEQLFSVVCGGLAAFRMMQQYSAEVEKSSAELTVTRRSSYRLAQLVADVATHHRFDVARLLQQASSQLQRQGLSPDWVDTFEAVLGTASQDAHAVGHGEQAYGHFIQNPKFVTEGGVVAASALLDVLIYLSEMKTQYQVEEEKLTAISQTVNALFLVEPKLAQAVCFSAASGALSLADMGALFNAMIKFPELRKNLDPMHSLLCTFDEEMEARDSLLEQSPLQVAHIRSRLPEAIEDAEMGSLGNWIDFAGRQVAIEEALIEWASEDAGAFEALFAAAAEMGRSNGMDVDLLTGWITGPVASLRNHRLGVTRSTSGTAGPVGSSQNIASEVARRLGIGSSRIDPERATHDGEATYSPVFWAAEAVLLREMSRAQPANQTVEGVELAYRLVLLADVMEFRPELRERFVSWIAQLDAEHVGNATALVTELRVLADAHNTNAVDEIVEANPTVLTNISTTHTYLQASLGRRRSEDPSLGLGSIGSIESQLADAASVEAFFRGMERLGTQQLQQVQAYRVQDWPTYARLALDISATEQEVAELAEQLRGRIDLVGFGLDAHQRQFLTLHSNEFSSRMLMFLGDVSEEGRAVLMDAVAAELGAQAGAIRLSDLLLERSLEGSLTEEAQLEGYLVAGNEGELRMFMAYLEGYAYARQLQALVNSGLADAGNVVDRFWHSTTLDGAIAEAIQPAQRRDLDSLTSDDLIEHDISPDDPDDDLGVLASELSGDTHGKPSGWSMFYRSAAEGDPRFDELEPEVARREITRGVEEWVENGERFPMFPGLPNMPDVFGMAARVTGQQLFAATEEAIDPRVQRELEDSVFRVREAIAAVPDATRDAMRVPQIPQVVGTDDPDAGIDPSSEPRPPIPPTQTGPLGNAAVPEVSNGEQLAPTDLSGESASPSPDVNQGPPGSNNDRAGITLPLKSTVAPPVNQVAEAPNVAPRVVPSPIVRKSHSVADAKQQPKLGTIRAVPPRRAIGTADQTAKRGARPLDGAPSVRPAAPPISVHRNTEPAAAAETEIMPAAQEGSGNTDETTPEVPTAQLPESLEPKRGGFPDMTF